MIEGRTWCVQALRLVETMNECNPEVVFYVGARGSEAELHTSEPGIIFRMIGGRPPSYKSAEMNNCLMFHNK